MTEDELQENAIAVLLRLYALPPITLTIGAQDLYELIASLQLTATHPGIGTNHVARLRHLGDQLIDGGFPGDPEIVALLRLGWDRRYDQPTKGTRPAPPTSSGGG